MSSSSATYPSYLARREKNLAVVLGDARELTMRTEPAQAFGDRPRPPTWIDDADELHDRSEDCPARRVLRHPVLRREPNYESR
jgi:hypothetical protein